jgi:HAD superfamily hydrolase (TIGR01549 family)
VFDLDGTLIDTDAALLAPFVAAGVPAEAVTFGHVLTDECERLGVSLDFYLDHYDEEQSQPFAGVVELVAEVARLGRWAVCSNKHPRSGRAELARLGWEPEIALFSDAFDGPKRLEPVLEELGVTASDIVFVGDTAHDRVCAREVGVRFGLAGWNPRARGEDGDVVLARPADVLDLMSLA